MPRSSGEARASALDFGPGRLGSWTDGGPRARRTRPGGAGAGRRRARAGAERDRRRARGAGAARRRRPSASASRSTCTSTTWPRCARIRAIPGEEAPRDALWGLTATLPGARAGPAVPERARRRRRPGNGGVAARPVVGRDRGRPAARPRRARHEGRRGRGDARAGGDPRAGVEAPEVVLQAVASEEDGGLGTFAALERDAALRRRAAARADRAPRRVRAGGRADVPRRRAGPRRARGRTARGLLGDRPLRARPRGAAGARDARSTRPSRIR